MVRRGPVSESRRQADVFRYLPPDLKLDDLTTPDIELPPAHHVPRSSGDTALIAFAQLGAMRLKASRALITLIDEASQHILAEATPTSTLRSDASMATAKDKLWLGCARIPRSRSICDRLIGLDPNTIHSPAAEQLPVLIVNDLQSDEQYASQWFAQGGLNSRFYAGIPLISPKGMIVGSYCVFDTSPRAGLSTEELLDLRDLAMVIMKHLHSSRLRIEHSRAERMVRGLKSFVEGAKTLQTLTPSEDDLEPVFVQSPPQDKDSAPQDKDSAPLDKDPAPLDKGSTPPDDQDLRTSARGQSRTDVPVIHISTRDHSRSETAQEKILPTGTKRMFARAANIMKDTSEFDGVVIFDAIIAATPKKGHFEPTHEEGLRPGPSGQELSTYDSGSSSTEGQRRNSISSLQSENTIGRSRASSSASGRISKTCEVLGFATQHGASVDDLQAALPKSEAMREKILGKLLQKYPDGHIFSFNASGEASSTDQNESKYASQDDTERIIPPTRRAKHRKRSIGDAILKVAPGARSLAFVPLWDFERARWFATCLCWTTNSYRALSETTDLSFIKAFGNSVMTELSRLDAVASSKTKSNFASLMSHELRSPLHGILGGVQLLQDTRLDAFQDNMLGAIDTCGRTLLDTVDHLLDHVKINEYAKLRSNVQDGKHKSSRTSGKGPSTHMEQYRSLNSTLDLSHSAEDVIEAVFAGQSYGTIAMRVDDEEIARPQPVRMGSQNRVTPNVISSKTTRKPITILVDIPSRDSWTFETSPGAWRRILINVFGNALKYTDEGYIKVSMRVENDSTTGKTYVITSVKDSGIGISSHYLLNRLYRPFSQENIFYSGTGLGLSIVRQLVDSLDGYIDLKSQVGVGTEVSVALPLRSCPPQPSLQDDDDPMIALSNMKDFRVCLYETRPSPESRARLPGIPDEPVTRGASLLATIEDWFRMDGFITNQWQARSADLVISSELSFDLLTATHAGLGPEEKPPSIIFITVDAIEAAALINDARILNSKSVVEIVIQPCGAHKLAKAILSCMKRHESASNIREMQPIRESTPNMPNGGLTESPRPQLPKIPSTESDTAPQVLIVDDNQINRRLLATLMKKLRLPYCEAEDGSEAVEIYKNSSPKLQIIIMDLSMPVMDGMTATREIRSYEEREKLNPCRIVALTGLASQSTRLEAKESGLDHFITKPARFGDLTPLLPSSPVLR